MASEPKDIRDWQELTRLTGGEALVVERVRLADRDIAIEGAFALPELARLAAEDQVFVAAFVRSHGSIKDMEQVFGVSYPTIKARLNRIATSLEFVETNPGVPRSQVLERLDRGEITAEDAIRARDCGVDGIVVSNHGGRQLDGALSTAKALPSIAEAMGDDLLVLADSGVRSGLDVLRMLALGARGVLLGRAAAFALAARGQAGVEHMLDMIANEMRIAMTLAGVGSIAEVDGAILAESKK